MNRILTKYTDVYKLSKSQEKVITELFIDEIKVFAKNEKVLETLIVTVGIYSEYIVMKFEKCAILIMRSGKRYMTEGIE